jgi:hypothetical protein
LKLSEILFQVDAMVPNALQDSIKIGWINQIQNELYRDYPVMENVFKFTTVVGEGAYTLPKNIPPDRIQYIMIGKTQYPYAALTDEETIYTHFWTTIISGDIMLYPVPVAPEEAVIYYRPRPNQLAASRPDEEPTFPEDFQELLILGCAARVARVNPETLTLAGIYDLDFQRLADKADRVLTKPKQKTTTIARPWM